MIDKTFHFRSTVKERVSRFVILLLLVGLSVPLLAGCTKRNASFTDGVGRTLELKQTPEKIVSLSPAHTEILFALGLGDKVVGVSNWCNKPSEALEKEKVGDAFSLNKELLVALGPDIAFIPGTAESPQVAEIENLGIAVYVSSPATVTEVIEDIVRVAKVVGADKAAEDLAGQMKRDLDALTSKLEALGGERRSVLAVLDQDLWTVGSGSFLDDVLRLSGAENIAGDIDIQYFQISMEEVLAKDPDAILVTIPEDQIAGLKEQVAWGQLRAVKENAVYYVDSDLVSRPGPYIVDAIGEIAAHLYPDSVGN